MEGQVYQLRVWCHQYIDTRLSTDIIDDRSNLDILPRVICY